MTAENQRSVDLANSKGFDDVLSVLEQAAGWWDNIDEFFAQIATGTPNKVDDFVVKFLGLVLPAAAGTAHQIKSIAEIIKIAKTPEEKAILLKDAIVSIGKSTEGLQVFFLTLLMKSIEEK